MRASSNRREFLANSAALTLTAASYQRVLGANERIGVGFIGYGLIGKKHVATFAKLPDVDPVAAAEVHRGRLGEALKVLGDKAKGYDDFRRLLDNKQVNAVVVATPDHWHALMTMLACAAGKDVYVEKPLNLFVREGEWMLAVAQRTGRVVQVGTQQRSGKHYQHARDLLREGHLGKIVSVRTSSVRNIMPGFGNPPDQDPPKELDWDQWLGPAPARKYNPDRALYHFRWFWDYSGGQMTNLGAHHLDIVDWVLGLDRLRSVASVGGRFSLQDNGETPDTQEVLFQLHGWTVTFTMRECALGSPAGPGLEFFGSKGSLGISRSGFKVFADPEVPPANLIPGVKEGHPIGGPQPVPVTGPAKPRTEALEDKTGDSNAQYLDHARNFLDCMRSRKQPISDLESAHRVAIACHLANLSLRVGRPLRWDPKKRAVIGDEEANQWLTRSYRPPWDKELKALGIG